MASFDILVKDLQNLGLQKGDTVIVHSSLKSMGQVEGGADTVIDALIEVVGENGTVLFPALSWWPCTTTLKFDAKNTASCVGKIPETFRKRPNVLRSLHPTHSVCAYGKLAYELTKDHQLDTTPVGPNSPYQKLIGVDGKILMLGCGLRPNTFMHGVEEVGNAPYCLGDAQTYTLTDMDGKELQMTIKGHNFHRPNGNLNQRYDRAVNLLEKGVDYFEGSVHNAEAYLIKAKPLCEKAVAKMQSDPIYFIDDLDGALDIKSKIDVYNIYVVFKCKPDMREAFIAKLKEEDIIDTVRREKGCIKYDYYYAEKNSTEILLIEAWDSKQDQQVHIAQPHMARLREIKNDYVISTKLVEFDIK